MMILEINVYQLLYFVLIGVCIGWAWTAKYYQDKISQISKSNEVKKKQ
jgi:hypothetical protein